MSISTCSKYMKIYSVQLYSRATSQAIPVFTGFRSSTQTATRDRPRHPPRAAAADLRCCGPLAAVPAVDSGGKRAAPAVLASPAKQPARTERGPVDEVSAYLQQQLKERQWDYDLVSLAADARVTLDANLVGLQVPRTSEAASCEPNVVYEELQWCTLT